MYSLTVENANGEQMNLTHNPNYTITNIDGLYPPDATINTVGRAGHDGSLFNSAYVNNRQIILNFVINNSACENRNNLYRFFQTARPVRLIYTNDLRWVYIDGYVKNSPVGFFAKKQNVQVTIICPDPFWHSPVPAEGTTGQAQSLFEFPFSIDSNGIPFSDTEWLDPHTAYIWNPGTVASGVIIELRAGANGIVNPRVYHQNTDKYIKVNTTLSEGDVLTIDTRTDHKRIARRRSGTDTNMIGYRDPGSTWLTMEPGDNVYILGAAYGLSDLSCLISGISNFEGV